MSTSITCAVIDLGCLLPGRYERIADYARQVGVPPGALVALLTGVEVDMPGDEILPPEAADRLASAVAVRRAVDRGEVAWAEAMGTVFAAFHEAFGQPWDARGYQAYLAAGPGPALQLARSRALVNLGEHMPVVCVATAPVELGPATVGLIDLATTVQVSGTLGVARPDPAVWRRALVSVGLAAEWGTALVVVDDVASAAALRDVADAPGEVWHLAAGNEVSWLARLAQLAD